MLGSPASRCTLFRMTSCIMARSPQNPSIWVVTTVAKKTPNYRFERSERQRKQAERQTKRDERRIERRKGADGEPVAAETADEPAVTEGGGESQTN